MDHFIPLGVLQGYSPPAWLPVLPAHAALLVIKHNSHLPAAPASRKTTGQEEKE